MFLYNTYVFFTLAAVILISILLVLRHKTQITFMNGMIISMFLGMNIGLTGGILLGTVFRGDLYMSTILSLLLGAAAGTIIGTLFSAAATIEGFMSGIMGGMMGAMLGEMLLPEKSLILINIFLTISLAALFLFKILPKNESSITTKKYLIRPILTFILLVIYLYLGSQLGQTWIETLKGSTHHQEHLHHL
ncbi:hypothetical protein LC048_14780 [Mesobacillus subterraneus]|uniref:hypothetical protein n=1 Tax=Mesobacillus subterraneus TaxID=285983 RepID=UPI001CFC5C03|nr:hypothetical protein [Mesobacillus subterraneus]WLR53777.1 hypothetical protein LC048_14780 [Mesobacillus subterraneus]